MIYFTSAVVDPSTTLFMGRDKYENEDLIKYGWPEDVWFHVDKLSSAHVYLRLSEGQTIDNLPKVLIEDAAQLVKQNSIEGCKINDVDVVYTLWSNLHKTESMAVGQIGFHSQRAVKKVRVAKKDKDIIRRLDKTKVEKDTVDFREERDLRDRNERESKKQQFKKIEEQKKVEEQERKAAAELRSYTNLMQEEKMTSNKDACGDGSDSDDFM